MALVKSKVLGLYVLPSNYSNLSTSPYLVATGSTLALAKTAAGSAAGVYMLVNASGVIHTDTANANKPAIMYYTGSAWSNIASSLTILAAATNTSLDLSNTVNEVVARDGAGGSETYIVGGAQSWNLTADGFMTTESDNDGESLMDLARSSQYVLARFVTNVEDLSAASNQYIGQGLLESCSISGGFDDNITYNVTISGYGKLNKF